MNACRLLSLGLMVGLGLPAVLRAEDKPVAVQVWVIRATTRSAEVSPELSELAKALKKQFKYTGYKLEKKASSLVGMGRTYRTDLIGGYRAALTPKQRADRQIKLQFQLTRREGKAEKRIFDSTFTIRSGPLQPLGGWPLEGDETLILAVRAR